MYKPSVIARIKHNIILKTNHLFALERRRKLQNFDFSIISNNCWGGHIYEYFGLPKQSPTVGCFFFADDYLQFCKKLKYYLEQKLEFINVKDSRYYSYLKTFGGDNLRCPIGLLNDIEIVFLHYLDATIAKDKWNRRIDRVNFDNLIFKFSYQNNCNLEHIRIFDEMDLPGKKICFTNKRNIAKCGVYIPGFETETLVDDVYCSPEKFDIVEFLNE